MNCPPSQPSTFAIRTCQHLNPKLQKSLSVCHRLLSRYKKTKSFKDRENGMTELKKYRKPLKDKNALLVTSCKRNCPAAGATQGNLRLHEER